MGALIVALLAGWLPALQAQAVPSFARQTNLPCQTCHTSFPQLTPFGRAFKMQGYTMSNTASKLPPLAVMLQGAPGYTHTRKDQAVDDVPKHFHDNDNLSINEVSFFYAGRLFGPYAESLAGKDVAEALNKIGVFAQGTWDGVEHSWAMDNTELRAATATQVAGKNLVVGGYVNNNPTMQDLWNTTPAWGYPFSGSGLAPGPDAAPLIADALAQHTLGFGAYGMFADTLYVEAGGYTALGAKTQRNMGVDPTDGADVAGMAPYWRVALEHDWGSNSMEVGTYGLDAHTFPGRDRSAGHDHFTDVGLDAQYQYITPRHEVTLMANWINEHQDLDASVALGGADNRTNRLWTATLTGSYLFDDTYGFDTQYFHTEGDRDMTAYGSRTGLPNSDGWIFQLDYLPFQKGGGPSFWPRSNVKFSLQYILYDRFNGSRTNFDGSGRDARDNDTLYLQAWLAF